MRVLGIRSAVAATIAAALLPAGVGTAGPAAPEPRTVTVFATCAPAGRVALRQTAGADSTHVVLRGRHLRVGRWAGRYVLETGAGDSTEVPLSLRARDDAERARGGGFRTEFDVPGVGHAATLALRHGPSRRCRATFDEGRSATVVSGATTDLVVHTTSDGVRVHAAVACRRGTRWRLQATAVYAEGRAGRTVTEHCRRGAVRAHGIEPGFVPAAAPLRLILVAQDDAGHTRRLAYSATRPAR